jgi:peptidoglycan L-alanyl-D-glutamate endopeptidase CwlK
MTTTTYAPDPRSATNIATLLPAARRAALALLATANDGGLSGGIVVKIICGTRTYAEQDALYAQGRTAPGPIVTNARGGYSNHNFGIAFDIGIFNGGVYLEDSPLYTKVGAIGRAQGLEWGGEWIVFTDEPHFQLPSGCSLAEQRELMAGGKWELRWV